MKTMLMALLLVLGFTTTAQAQSITSYCGTAVSVRRPVPAWDGHLNAIQVLMTGQGFGFIRDADGSGLDYHQSSFLNQPSETDAEALATKACVAKRNSTALALKTFSSITKLNVAIYNCVYVYRGSVLAKPPTCYPPFTFSVE